MHKLDEGVKTLHKHFGKGVGGQGADYPELSRLPTGIFTVDVALAGGIPLGAVSIFYGMEGSGKTSLSMRCVGQYQKRFPDKHAVWIDAENAWDRDWAKLHGVDTDRLYLFKPTTAEEAADIAKEVAYSEDAGFLVIDSIAALASNEQIEKTADKVVVAGAAKPTTNLMRGVGTGMVEHVKAGSQLTVIYINQIRHKIGFVMGNPEILPGPSFQNYQAYLKLRLTGKPIIKEKISAAPIYSDNSMKVAKKKFPIIRSSAEWQTILYPYNGFKPPDVNNHKTMEHLLEELGYLEKNGSEWLLYGEPFKTKTEAVATALADYDNTLAQVCDDLLLLYKDKIAANLDAT